jgi:predicted NBD/HSP70 family sugar kinase
MRVLDVVLRNGRISRANIAKELGLTRSTASSIVAGLADEGLLIDDNSEEDKGAGTGRPGTFVRLNAEHALFVGADIGVGRVCTVALGLDALPIAEQIQTFDVDTATPDTLIGMVVDSVRQIEADVGERFTSRVLCVTIPGLIDKAGNVLRAPFLGWRNEPLLDKLRGRLPGFSTVVAENDANAFAFADAFLQRNAYADSEIYLFLDAGVGGAIIKDGQLVRGVDGYAGEFGHVIIGDEGFVQLATPKGSIESFIGLEAVLARYRYHGGTSNDFSAFYDAVMRKEAAALGTLRDWTFYLGRTVALIGSIFNPTRIVLGGKVSSLFPLCGEFLDDCLSSHLLLDQPVPEIRISTLDVNGPAVGGALILHRQMFSLDEGLVFRTKLAV